MDDTMDAWVIDATPGRYRWGRVPVPEVGHDGVRIRVVASALNHLDLWVARGMPAPPVPHVPGSDFAGIVEAIGPGVTSVVVGDEVVVNPGLSPVSEIAELGNDSPLGKGFTIIGEHSWGGHGTFAVVPERNVRPRPAGRTWEQCAAFPLAYVTAYRMLRRARVRAGHTVLVVGIGSGVACAALALATAMGAEVHVTSRSGHKRTEALALGAVAAHDSAAGRWDVAADVVVESVGPATWDKSLRALKPGGRMVVCGGTSGTSATVTIPRLFFQQLEIIGSSMGSYTEFAELCQLVDGGLPIVIDKVLPLDEYPVALERMEAGEQLGKIVLAH